MSQVIDLTDVKVERLETNDPNIPELKRIDPVDEYISADIELGVVIIIFFTGVSKKPESSPCILV